LCTSVLGAPRAPRRKSQRVLVRLASLGDQFVFDFGGRKFFNPKS